MYRMYSMYKSTYNSMYSIDIMYGGPLPHHVNKGYCCIYNIVYIVLCVSYMLYKFTYNIYIRLWIVLYKRST